MRKELVGFVSAFALMCGAALAQDAPTPGGTDQPPSAQDMAPATPPTTGMGDEGTAAMDPATPPAGDTGMAAGPEVSVEEMVGRNVIGADGESLGKVADVVVDPVSGEMKQLVIESGGFLGIGAKTVAVDMAEAEIRPEEGIFLSSVTQADIEGMPEFDPETQTQPLDEPAASPGTDTGTGMGTDMPAAPSP
jgi:sporulation protein YlmC with PRC-barrel domain